MSLEDVGTVIKVQPDSLADQPKEVKVIMAIKAPRGEMRLYESVKKKIKSNQLIAIKSFVEMHLDD